MSAIYPSRSIPWSGPVAVPLTDESPAIQAAPAYDQGEAKRHIPTMPALRALIGGLPADDDLTLFGPASPDPTALARLQAEIRRFGDDGHKLSLVMADLKTLSGAAFHSTEWMCTQSTVKAVYVGAVLNRWPEAFHDNGQYIRDTIVLSDNEAYESLREIYGPEPIRAWCRETGVDESFAATPYPRDKTARDMFRLWTRLYAFLNDGSDVHNAGRYFADSAMSAAKERLSGRCRVQTKAGWENGLEEDTTDYERAVIPARFTDGDPLNDECATNDTGVVYAGHGPYIFVVYSDYPCPWSCPNRLYGLTEALYAYQASLSAPR